MANEQNIEPYKMRPNCERTARMTRNGGIASGKARRKKKAIREALEIALSARATGVGMDAIDSICPDVDEDEKDNTLAIACGQIIAAIEGNNNAAKWIADTVDGGAESSMEDDGLSKSLEELGKRL